MNAWKHHITNRVGTKVVLWTFANHPISQRDTNSFKLDIANVMERREGGGAFLETQSIYWNRMVAFMIVFNTKIIVINICV